MEDINPKNDLHTLIPIEEFKALMGVDDRDDKTARFCLVTATLTIEEYCKRKFLRKQYFETIPIINDYFVLPLREYPVREILLVSKKNFGMKNEGIIEPEFYRPMIGNGYNEEIIFELLLSPSLKPYQLKAIKVNFIAGYSLGEIPSNLSAACLELASWNFNRYKGKRIGMSGNIMGAGVQGEHFEMSIPENVRCLIEPYKRKTI
jgi:hypothetical protein